MTEIVGIRQDVTNLDYHSPPQPSVPSVLPYKRRVLDRRTERIKASSLPGTNLVTDYLHEKYIKNLSVRTIDNSGGTILSFLRFLDREESSILTLTRRDISAFVEYEQDKGLKVVSIILHLRVIYAFVAYLVKKEVIPPEIIYPKVRMQEPDALPKAIPYEDIECVKGDRPRFSMNDQQKSPQYLAAIDLGSNSFHLVVARIEDGHVHILDKIKEMVRLGGGLDKNGRLTEEVRIRALSCLDRFAERLQKLPQGSVAAVGTNTLRRAKNSRQFLKSASDVLGHPISIIGGKEEARLIYLGVSHSLVAEDGKRLVMDIGGGSTELIIGKGFEPLHLRSLEMGCVSMSRAFFRNGKLSKKNWEKAGIAAHLELRPVRHYFRKVGWVSATGASGTIRAAGSILKALGLETYYITRDSLKEIRRRMIAAGHVKNLDLPGLDSDRQPVFAGGLAILIATFEALKIETMQVSEGALREGLLYERLGRIQSEDTRLKTLSSVQQRFQISQKHARRVSLTSHRLLTACEKAWDLRLEDAEILHWASSLHEIGLAVSLSGYHKHGAYLLEKADLPGFALEEQDRMSVLVGCHRKKISKKSFRNLPEKEQKTALRLAILLRLATLLHRSRKDETAVIEQVIANENNLTLRFAQYELINHPLQRASLEQEAKYLKNVDFNLKFTS